MSRIYLPSTGPHDWQWLLARPGLHWKHGASAMALADAWEHADEWPAAVEEAIKTDAAIAGLKLLLALPEYETPLPGAGAASQTDLLVLARNGAGELVIIAVEGKAEEPFGDHTVSEWRALSESKGRRARLAHLVATLELPDDHALARVRYQLLHRTAAAILEARRFGAHHAVMLVHSFSPTAKWFDEFNEFADLYGAHLEHDTVVSTHVLAASEQPLTLHLGWVSDTPRPLHAAPPLGPRFDRAFALARELHASQHRKKTEIPYVSHLMGVASLVLEDGGCEDQAIAALLHDAVEDQGGQATLTQIRQLFGERVARIVEACSDTDVVPKPPWRARKEAYIAHLQSPGLVEGAVRVSLADKLHNARAILFDLRAGHDVFARFGADYADQAWYYRALVATFADLTASPMVAELGRVVNELFADA